MPRDTVGVFSDQSAMDAVVTLGAGNAEGHRP